VLNDHVQLVDVLVFWQTIAGRREALEVDKDRGRRKIKIPLWHLQAA